MSPTKLFVILSLVAVVFAQVPADWTCPDALYDSLDACDCDCGAYDPDCDTLSFVRGCDVVEGSISYCDAEGECIYVERVVPSSWHCEDISYDNGDGVCNCGCGAVDPDCNNNPTAVADCHNGLNPTCSVDGLCEYGAPLPEGWVCSGYAYDNNNGCDCACGIPDPDCATQPDVVFGCPCEEMTCTLGYCAGFCDGFMLYVTESGETVEVTADHAPIEERFRIDHPSEKMPEATISEDNEELPFFGRNHIDRSVSQSTLKRYIHSTAPSEHVKNMLVQWGVYDPKQTEVMTIPARKQVLSRASRATPPAEWTCNPSYYDAQDGCDCECGAHDPDCDLPHQYTYGCSLIVPEGDFRPSCSPDDTCTFVEIEIPEDWRCDPDYYAYLDGCDCQCGAYDPDCDLSGSIVFNCNQGYDPVCTAESECTYLTPIPEDWFCPFFYYEDGFCDCNCGAPDTDCDVEHDEVYGCGRCGDPATMTCDTGLCVGECEGVFLSFEKLDYWNPLLQAGAPDIEDFYVPQTSVVNYSPWSFSAKSPLSPLPDDDDSSIEQSPVDAASISFKGGDNSSASSASAVTASVALLLIAGIAAF